MARLMRGNQQMSESQIADTFNKTRRLPDEINWISELAKGARIHKDEDGREWIMMADADPRAPLSFANCTGVYISRRSRSGYNSGEEYNPSRVYAQAVDGNGFVRTWFVESHKTENISYFTPCVVTEMPLYRMPTDEHAKHKFEIHGHPDWPLGRQGGLGGTSGKGGCYVATCVYGSYDSPEVLALRRFRDTDLSRTKAGRQFIRCYYAISPKIVRLLGNKTWFNSFCKLILDRIVHKLEKSGVKEERP